MHNTIRLFTEASLQDGADVPATPGQARYLGSVMRRGVGDPVRLFNGCDGEWLAAIATLSRDRARFAVQRLLRPQTPPPDVQLVFAVLKRDATDLVVQKATELGAGVIQPVFTERTNAGRVNLDRLTLIATEAAEQSERMSIPELRPPLRLAELLAGWPADRVMAAAIERAEAPSIRAIASRRPAALLVGPEGGFTGAELDVLRRHPFVVPITLGPHILRAETAAIVGLALLQAETAHL
jgi:16S rRNA (uracil1498-N3)-methyltransferase